MRAAALTSYGSRDWGVYLRAKKRAQKREDSFSWLESARNLPGKIKISLMAGTLMAGAIAVILGALYLYQINSIAAKGYEIREIEDQIKELNQENEKLKIKEVELKSMYNIEKSMKDLDLVSSSSISYVEMEKPVAMK